MKSFRILLILITTITFWNCKTTQLSSAKTSNKSHKIILKTIEAHATNQFEKKAYQFVFRDKLYSFDLTKGKRVYTMLSSKDARDIKDVSINGSFIREINGIEKELSSKERNNLNNSLNSVIYFATLPHSLLDPAVNHRYLENQDIKGQSYQLIEVSFDQADGGDDFEDQYIYWINTKTSMIDYLAYNYKVGKGGVRFRSALNRQNIDQVIFQDYANYKAEVGTPLDQLAELFEANELEKLSMIELENIKRIN